MFEALFGTEMPLALRFFIAFLVVLALIGGGIERRGAEPPHQIRSAADQREHDQEGDEEAQRERHLGAE